jgi:acetylglutamate kinase
MGGGFLPRETSHFLGYARSTHMDELVEKAKILHEALPYIRRFQSRTFVVKYGGHAMLDAELKESFARDVCLLRYVGIQVVVVHGGGPQIDEMLERMGIKSSFSGGLRITDDATMHVVEMVLGGSLNQDIVGLICKQGGRAVGLSGKDDHFMRARKMEGVLGKADDGRVLPVDLGRVGDVERVDPRILDDLIRAGFIPVIAPIGVDENGDALNVNADTAAARIAAALRATKLMLMTDVSGVKDADGTLISSLGAREAEELIAREVIKAGMIPKVRCALDAVSDGVDKVHVIDGRRRHALLLEIFTDSGVGTEIRRTEREPARSH